LKAAKGCSPFASGFSTKNAIMQKNSNYNKKRIIGVWDTNIGYSDLPPMSEKKSTKKKRPKKQKKISPLNHENPPNNKRPKTIIEC
jgi:hypothetical protein